MIFHFNNLTKKDFEYGLKFLGEQEISPLTREDMFRAAIFCILSTTENYQKQNSVYNELLLNKLDTHENIQNNPKRLEEILDKTRFPNSKLQRILKFTLYWQNSILPEEIINDFNNGKRNEFNLRNQVAEEAPGISYKCASMFMNICGYRNVVPVDRWMLRFLESQGHNIKIKRGITKTEYLLYEKTLSEIAYQHNVLPAEFQAALWCKYSSFKPMFDQLELPLNI